MALTSRGSTEYDGAKVTQGMEEGEEGGEAIAAHLCWQLSLQQNTSRDRECMPHLSLSSESGMSGMSGMYVCGTQECGVHGILQVCMSLEQWVWG